MFRLLKGIPRCLRQQWLNSTRNSQSADNDQKNKSDRLLESFRPSIIYSFNNNEVSEKYHKYKRRSKTSGVGKNAWPWCNGADAVAFGATLACLHNLHNWFVDNGNGSRKPCSMEQDHRPIFSPRCCIKKWFQHLLRNNIGAYQAVCLIFPNRSLYPTQSDSEVNEVSADNESKKLPVLIETDEHSLVSNKLETDDILKEDIQKIESESRLSHYSDFKIYSLPRDETSDYSESLDRDNYQNKSVHEANHQWEQTYKHYSLVYQNQRANIAASNGNQSVAFALWQNCSKLGYSKAHYNLGVCYENGFGTSVNRKLAAEHYALASIDSHPEAMFNLALMMLNDNDETGYSSDKITRARSLLERASRHGLSRAQTELGVMYASDGNVTDLSKAVHLFAEAAVLHDSTALYYLAVCYENGIAVSENRSIAVELYRLAAKSGNQQAQEILHTIDAGCCNNSYNKNEGNKSTLFRTISSTGSLTKMVCQKLLGIKLYDNDLEIVESFESEIYSDSVCSESDCCTEVSRDSPVSFFIGDEKNYDLVLEQNQIVPSVY